MSCTVVTHGARCQCSADPASAPATPTPAAATVVRCECGKRASVSVTLLPRPLPMFGGPVTVEVCPSCYGETVRRGQVLSQQSIAQEES